MKYEYDIGFVVSKDGFELKVNVENDGDIEQKVVNSVCHWIRNRNFGELENIEWYEINNLDLPKEGAKEISVKFGIDGSYFRKVTGLPRQLPENIRHIEDAPPEDREILLKAASDVDAGYLNEEKGLKTSYTIGCVRKSGEVLL